MGEPTVSIAMATYKGARFLAEQLATLAAQTRLPDELVICDDQSPDETIEILSDFAKSAPFPVHIHRNPERLGYIRNFRRAAGLCTGDLIAFCDQDDWWHADKLERMVVVFADPAVMCAYHNARLVDNQREGTALLLDSQAEQDRLAVKPFYPWLHSYGMAEIFRASLCRFDHLWNGSRSHVHDPVDIMSHDHWYMFLALAYGEVRFVDAALVDYRQHGGNAVGANPGGVGGFFARLEHYGRQDQRQAEAARARADVMRGVAAEDEAVRARALDMAGRYDRFADKLERRYRAYARGSMPARLVQLGDSVRRGDYRDWPWGFDRRGIVRDLWSGVLLGRVKEPV